MKTQNSWRYFLVFLYPSAHKNKFLTLLDIKKPTTLLWVFFCGERGIRTPGGVTLNGFQDRRIRPLCHFSSGCKYTVLFCLTKPPSSFIITNFTSNLDHAKRLRHSSSYRCWCFCRLCQYHCGWWIAANAPSFDFYGASSSRSKRNQSDCHCCCNPFG